MENEKKISRKHEKYVKTCSLWGHKMHGKSMKMRPGSPRAFSGAPGGSQNAKKWVHLQHFRGFVAPLADFGRHFGSGWLEMAARGSPNGHEHLLKSMAKSIQKPMPENIENDAQMIEQWFQNCSKFVREKVIL